MRRFWQVIVGMTVGLALGGATTMVVASDASSSEGVSELVEQLGSPSFSQREIATRQLTRLGPAAEDALRHALRSGDAEIRIRARRILEQVLERDFYRRLQAFSMDESPDDAHGLPGWKRFHEEFGNDPATRRLFVEMQRAEPRLMAAAQNSPRAACAALETRMHEMQEELWEESDDDEQPPSAARTAAMIFVASDPKLIISELLSEETASYVAGLAYQGEFSAAAHQSAESGTLKKLLGAWVKKGLAGGVNLREQNLMLAHQFELPEALNLGLSLLSEESVEPYLRPYAIMAVAKYGRQEHLPALAALLNDATPCGDYDEEDEDEPETVVCQVRDAALAAMICLAGQSLSDFGFEGIDNSDALQLDLSELGFRTPAQREKAFAQWQKWAAENALPIAR